MENAQFGRFYELQIADLLIRDLDIAFQVTKTLDKEPNTLELVVYNLNPEHQQQLQSTKNPVVQLEAGYKSNSGVIFLGDVREVGSQYQRPDWVTTLSSGDGEQAMKFDRINKSFVNGSTLKTVLTELGKAMPSIGIGNLNEALAQAKIPGAGTDQFINGVTVSGNASRELDRIVRSAGFEWSIQNKKFQILEAGKALATEAVLLTPGTGLIGSPTIDSDGILNFVALLNSDILPGKQVRIVSTLIDGFFRVERATYSGDLSGTDWYVQCEAKLLGL